MNADALRDVVFVINHRMGNWVGTLVPLDGRIFFVVVGEGVGCLDGSQRLEA